MSRSKSILLLHYTSVNWLWELASFSKNRHNQIDLHFKKYINQGKLIILQIVLGRISTRFCLLNRNLYLWCSRIVWIWWHNTRYHSFPYFKIKLKFQVHSRYLRIEFDKNHFKHWLQPRPIHIWIEHTTNQSFITSNWILYWYMIKIVNT